MKTMINTIAISIAATALIAGASVGHAKHAGHDHGHDKNPEKMVERVTEKLSLDEKQQDALRVLVSEKQKLRAEKKAQREAKKAQYKVAKEKGQSVNKGPLAALADSDQISVADINKILDEKQAKRRERQQPVLQAFVDFRNSLSAEQREKAQPIFRKLLRGVIGKRGNKHKKDSKKKQSKQ